MNCSFNSNTEVNNYKHVRTAGSVSSGGLGLTSIININKSSLNVYTQSPWRRQTTGDGEDGPSPRSPSSQPQQDGRRREQKTLVRETNKQQKKKIQLQKYLRCLSFLLTRVFSHSSSTREEEAAGHRPECTGVCPPPLSTST